eukprot:366366-Chlamydomonas_euryale.AAC.13
MCAGPTACKGMTSGVWAAGRMHFGSMHRCAHACAHAQPRASWSVPRDRPHTTQASPQRAV